MTHFLNNRRIPCFSTSVSSAASTTANDTTTSGTSDADSTEMANFEQQMEDESDANTIKQGELEEKQDELHQTQAAALKAFKEEDIS